MILKYYSYHKKISFPKLMENDISIYVPGIIILFLNYKNNPTFFFLLKFFLPLSVHSVYGHG
jgi:hypothetical protein